MPEGVDYAILDGELAEAMYALNRAMDQFKWGGVHWEDIANLRDKVAETRMFFNCELKL